MEQSLPVLLGQLEVQSRRLSKSRKLFAGLSQNRIAAVLVQVGSDDPEIRVYLVPDWLSMCSLTEFALDIGRFAAVRGFFIMPDGSAEILSGNKALTDLSAGVLDVLADRLKTITDPETGQATRRFHALAPLEDTRIRYPGGNGQKWRWTAGALKRIKEPTLLIQDMSEVCGLAYGFRSPDGSRAFTDLVSITLKDHRGSILEHALAWDLRACPVQKLPFLDGSRVRRVGQAALLVVNLENGPHRDTRLLTLQDGGAVHWSPSLPDPIIGRYAFRRGYGLVVMKREKNSFRIIPPALLKRYLTGACQALAAYLEG